MLLKTGSFRIFRFKRDTKHTVGNFILEYLFCCIFFYLFIYFLLYWYFPFAKHSQWFGERAWLASKCVSEHWTGGLFGMQWKQRYSVWLEANGWLYITNLCMTTLMRRGRKGGMLVRDEKKAASTYYWIITQVSKDGDDVGRKHTDIMCSVLHLWIDYTVI
jgi:hypothetical protein